MATFRTERFKPSRIRRWGNSTGNNIQLYLSICEPHEITDPIFPVANPYARRTTAGDRRMVTTAKRAAMVLGDLNTSPWSPSFRDLLKMGRLKDTRVGVGNQASWPAHFGMFGIPIDHFLINDQLVAHRRHIVRTFRGSDHSAIAIEIAIRR